MKSVPDAITPLSDISANIFALLIFILVVVMWARENVPRPEYEQRIFNIESGFKAVERRPLGSEHVLGLLYARRERSTSASVDLFDREIDINFNGQHWKYDSAAAAELQLDQIASSNVVLYIFSHHFYGRLSEGLSRSGRRWLELSVPDALKVAGTSENGQAWSAEFSELLSQPLSYEQFRSELALLLQASEGKRRSERIAQIGGSGSPLRQTVFQTVQSWLWLASHILMVAGGVVFVGWVELRGIRRHRHE